MPPKAFAAICAWDRGCILNMENTVDSNATFVAPPFNPLEETAATDPPSVLQMCARDMAYRFFLGVAVPFPPPDVQILGRPEKGNPRVEVGHSAEGVEENSLYTWKVLPSMFVTIAKDETLGRTLIYVHEEDRWCFAQPHISLFQDCPRGSAFLGQVTTIVRG